MSLYFSLPAKCKSNICFCHPIFTHKESAYANLGTEGPAFTTKDASFPTGLPLIVYGTCLSMLDVQERCSEKTVGADSIQIGKVAYADIEIALS